MEPKGERTRTLAPVAARVFCLRIPFVEGFAHSTQERRTSDAIVVRVEMDDGTLGYGEGLARPYVTGETVDSVVEHLREVLWPRVRRRPLPDLGADGFLAALDEHLGSPSPAPAERERGILAHHAARSSLELALVDAGLRSAGRSLATLLPPAEGDPAYGGVIGAGSREATLSAARRMQRFGLRDFKVKVGGPDGVARVAAVREVLGPQASIRVDVNGVWTLDEALRQLDALAALGVACCEEPLGRTRMAELPRLCRESPLPIMLDESLVTRDEARRLAAERACHLFNLRVSKCGGLAGTLAFVRIAREHGLGFALGSHVGETSLLSAAARHLAFALPDHRYLEGSYGTMLLSQDVTRLSLRFGHQGRASRLRAPGLGVDVLPERLERFAHATLDLA